MNISVNLIYNLLQTRAMKLETEQMEQDIQKKIKKMDQSIR